MKFALTSTSVFGLILFLVPAVYVLKYAAVDKPSEDRARREVTRKCGGYENTVCIARQTQGQRGDPVLTELYMSAIKPTRIVLTRRLAAEGLANIVLAARNRWTRPMDNVLIKAQLAASTKDPDSTVRATAETALGELAKHGAQLER